MNKTIYFVANWKMNGDHKSIKEIIRVSNYFSKNRFFKFIKIIFCPPSNLLSEFSNKVKNKLIKFGAQDISKVNLNYGPYTGQLSAKMLKNSGAEYVIIGHSEKRRLDEDEITIKKKIKAAIKNNLIIIFCIGENITQKKNGSSLSVLKKQISNSLNKQNINFKNLIIAYEPIWSIGTGNVPTNEYLFKIFSEINNFLKVKYRVNSPTLLYGGSVSVDNVATLSNVSLISGFLIGGASLKSVSLIKIIKNYFR